MERYLIIPDVHIPYHNKKSVRLVRQILEAEEFDKIILLGDVLDFYTISRYSKDPRRRFKLLDEVRIAQKELLDTLSVHPAQKIYTLGNHEHRLQKHLQEKSPELLDIVSVQSLLGLGKDWRVIPYLEAIKIGNTTFTHELGREGANAVHQVSRDVGEQVVFGHIHRQAMVVDASSTGVPRITLCPGWLGDPNLIDYQSRVKSKREWTQGFATAWNDNGKLHIQNVPIFGGSCVLDGKLFRAQ